MVCNMQNNMFNCPNCGQEIEFEESQSGSSVQCPLCLKTVAVPLVETSLETVKTQISNSSGKYIPGSISKLYKWFFISTVIGFIVIPLIFIVWDIMNGSESLIGCSSNLNINFADISILLFSLLNFICMIVSIVMASILLYRFWNIIQSGSRKRTTPGKAVGFCFIPFFNIYWIYVAYVGLARDMNLYCEENSLNFRMNVVLTQWWFFLTLSGIIPIIGLFTGIIALILYIVMLKSFSELSEKLNSV